MKAFITGISGFVGAGLAKRLLADGHEVHGLVRPSSLLWRLEEVKSRLHLHEGNLLEHESVSRILESVEPDVVFHLGVYGAYVTQTDNEKILKSSVLATLNLLETAKKCGVKMFVNTGSSSEYGAKDHPMLESERIDPNSYYAVGKAAQTLLCQHYGRTEKLPVVTLRLFSVYGPYEEPGRLVPTVIAHALAGRDIPIIDARIARDFVYLDDVSEAFVLASAKPELTGEVLNVGTGTQTTLQELANAVVRETKSKSHVILGAYEARTFDTFTWVADMQKTTTRLGFVPRRNLTNGLHESIMWFNNHAHYYKK